MNTADVERFAAEMLALPPRAAISVKPLPRPCSVAVWVGRMYGYTYNQGLDVVWNRGHAYRVVLGFTRSDEPGSRRRAEWMRNPAGDPAYPPPVAWHLNGGIGFHPPGWHPAARLVITPEIDGTLRYNDAQFGRQLVSLGVYPAGYGAEPLVGLPPLTPPPAPPNTIAYPDGPTSPR